MMGKMDIAFPNLHIYLRNVPKSFSVFGLEIALYAVIVMTGFYLGLQLILYLAKKSGQKEDDYWDAFFWILPLSIVGARIYSVIFDWNRVYRYDPLSAFNIRNGGLAIYGGVIAGVLTLFFFTKKRKLSFLQMGDTYVCGLVLGQAIGRWGNFTNREAFGEYTDNLFAMRIPLAMAYRNDEITQSHLQHLNDSVNYIQVHPTFLYESLWNLGLLVLLLLYFKHRRFQGEMILLYFAGYGLGRLWIEGIRTDQLKLPYSGLPVSQLLAGFLLLFCGTLWVTLRLRLRKKTENR